MLFIHKELYITNINAFAPRMARSAGAAYVPYAGRPAGNGAAGRISPTAWPAGPASAQPTAALTRDGRNQVITVKDFGSAKYFRSHSANFLPAAKSLHGHRGPARPRVIPFVTRVPLRRRSSRRPAGSTRCSPGRTRANDTAGARIPRLQHGTRPGARPAHIGRTFIR